MIFYGIGTATYAMFLQMARRWPQLMMQWSIVEQTQGCYGTSQRLRLKIRCITALILSGAAGISSCLFSQPSHFFLPFSCLLCRRRRRRNHHHHRRCFTSSSVLFLFFFFLFFFYFLFIFVTLTYFAFLS
jgi:hypothetical protein